MKIPQLTHSQYEVLTSMGKSNATFIAVPESNEGDDPEFRAKLLNRMNEIEDLVTLEILKDVSNEEKFAKIIQEAKSQGRSFRVFILTEIGFMMFAVTTDEGKSN